MPVHGNLHSFQVDDTWILRRLERWGRKDAMPFLGPKKGAILVCARVEGGGCRDHRYVALCDQGVRKERGQGAGEGREQGTNDSVVLIYPKEHEQLLPPSKSEAFHPFNAGGHCCGEATKACCGGGHDGR